MQGAEVLTRFKADTKNFDNGIKTINSKISSIAKGVGSAFIGGTALATTALAGLVSTSVNSFAKVEQSIGGVETLFKDSANTVIENAKKAYQTAGIDANKYMEQVTSFSASLLQSVGGDTVKAAKAADTAIIDMADNANKMGTSIEAIQNAYQGFAKQNYTMLDNLKLGYGGTKTEMERLLADAEKFSGVHYDISNLNDVYSAIHVIQGELGITGTTAKEASTTISGSMASAKAAFENFLSGQGGIEEVITTFTTAGTNISKAIIKLLPQISEGIVGIINGLIPLIPELIQSLFPGLVDGAVMLLNGIVEMAPSLIKTLAPMLPVIITSLIEGLVVIIQTLAEMMPELIPIIVDAIIQTIPILIDNLPLFIDAGVQLIKGLVKGLINSIPLIIQSIPKIVSSLINTFAKLLGIHSPSTVFANFGLMLIKGLVNGISNAKQMAINAVKNIGGAILKGIKGILGIHSPSTEFAMIGKFSVLGYTDALDKMKDDVQSQIAETFALSPQLSPTSSMHYSPNINVVNNVDIQQDPLGQMVNNIKTYAGGAKNDYNYGAGL